MTQALDRQRVRLPLLAGEKWWGGAVADGQAMPFGEDAEHHRDLAVSAGFLGTGVEYGGGNQSAPLLLSNRGRFIYSERPFEFRFDRRHRRGDRRRPDARPGGRRARGCVPDRVGGLLSGLRRRPRAADVPCSAVQHLDRNALPANPSRCAGLCAGVAGRRVAAGRADDRRPLVARLRNLDIRPGRVPGPGRHGPRAAPAGFLGDAVAGAVRQPGHRDVSLRCSAAGSWSGPRTAHRRSAHWWNGYSAVLDATNPGAVAWLHAELDALVDDYGIDGFKFDGGDLWSYRADDVDRRCDRSDGPVRGVGEARPQVPLQRVPGLLEDGRPAAGAAAARQATDVGSRRARLIDPGFHRAGPDRPCLRLPDMVGGGELGAFSEDRPGRRNCSSGTHNAPRCSR